MLRKTQTPPLTPARRTESKSPERGRGGIKNSASWGHDAGWARIQMCGVVLLIEPVEIRHAGNPPRGGAQRMASSYRATKRM